MKQYVHIPTCTRSCVPLGQTLKNQLFYTSSQNYVLPRYFPWQQCCSSPAMPPGDTALIPQLPPPTTFLPYFGSLASACFRVSEGKQEPQRGITATQDTRTCITVSRWDFYQEFWMVALWNDPVSQIQAAISAKLKSFCVYHFAELAAICPAKFSFNTFHWAAKHAYLITVIPSDASYIIWLCYPPCQGESDLVLRPRLHHILIMIQKVPQHSIWLPLPSAWNVQLRIFGYGSQQITQTQSALTGEKLSYCCFTICLLLSPLDLTVMLCR